MSPDANEVQLAVRGRENYIAVRFVRSVLPSSRPTGSTDAGLTQSKLTDHPRLVMPRQCTGEAQTARLREGPHELFGCAGLDENRVRVVMLGFDDFRIAWRVGVSHAITLMPDNALGHAGRGQCDVLEQGRHLPLVLQLGRCLPDVELVHQRALVLQNEAHGFTWLHIVRFLAVVDVVHLYQDGTSRWRRLGLLPNAIATAADLGKCRKGGADEQSADQQFKG